MRTEFSVATVRRAVDAAEEAAANAASLAAVTRAVAASTVARPWSSDVTTDAIVVGSYRVAA